MRNHCEQLDPIAQILDYFYGNRGNLHHREISLEMKFSNGTIVKGKHMTTTVGVDKIVTFSPVFADKFGNTDVKLGSVPAWSFSDETLATIVASEDGKSAVLTPTGKEGSGQVLLSVDADSSEGVLALTGTAEMTFVAGTAASISLNPVVADPAA